MILATTITSCFYSLKRWDTSDSNISAYPVILLDFQRFCIDFSYNGIIDILEKSNEAVREIAIEKKAHLVDNQALIPKTEEYFADNVHYTDKGSRIIAEAVASLIRENTENHSLQP